MQPLTPPPPLTPTHPPCRVQALVELENKADALRGMLEAVMDDEDELREINLSNRPRREERRKQRDVDRMKRQLERWARGGGVCGGVGGGTGGEWRQGSVMCAGLVGGGGEGRGGRVSLRTLAQATGGWRRRNRSGVGRNRLKATGVLRVGQQQMGCQISMCSEQLICRRKRSRVIPTSPVEYGSSSTIG
jgi:hypothetical protein